VIAQIPAGGVVTNVALYEPVAFSGTSTDVTISVGSVAGTSTNMVATTDIDATSGAFILGFNTGSVLVNTAAGYVANATTSAVPIQVRVAGTLTAAGTSSLDTSLGQVFTVTLPASGTSTVNVNTTTLVPGTVVRLIITGGAGTLTFGTGFKKQQVSPVVASVLTLLLANGPITFSFVSDGTNLYEVARTVALT
jgi:hypothetical protein